MKRSILIVVAALAAAFLTGGAPTVEAQGVAVVDDTCTYNEAIAGTCDLDRATILIQQLPGDGMADWYTTYGGLDVGCVRFGFEQTLCVQVEFSRGAGVSCVIYPTFTVCEADAEPEPASQIIVVVPENEDCTIEANGAIRCRPGQVPATAPPAPPVPVAPRPAFTG